MKNTLVLLAISSATLSGQTASGTLTIGADKFEMKHAAATLVKGATRIVLADKPIPGDLLDDEGQIWDLKTQGYHGMQIDIDADRNNYSLIVISSTLQGTITMSGTFHPEKLSVFTEKRVEGALEAAPEQIGEAKVGYAVKFATPVMPPEPAPTAADKTAAAGKESTKVYLSLVAAIYTGDKQKILELAPPDKRAAIDTPQFPEILKMVQAMTPKDIQVLKATETGDHAKLIARGTMDGAAQRGKIYLNRVNGKWIMASESWGSEK
jgi:hypothetical protein